MKTFIALVLVWVGLLIGGDGGGPANAAEGSAEVKALAGKAFDRGMRFYQRDDYDRAIEQFDIGYRLLPEPTFIYNIAQAHRLANRPEKALEFYRQYLQLSPAAGNRQEVLGRIAQLEKQLGPRAPGLTLILPPGPVSETEPAPEPLLAAPVEDSSSKKKRKAWPIVLGVIGGVVVVGAAVGLGVYFGTKEPSTAPFQPVTP